MTGRERVFKALNYRKVDRVPVDLGGTLGTGAHVSVIAKLRQALGLDRPGEPVKVIEPYQMLGEVVADLREALGIDTVNLPGPKNFFGFGNTDWKPWRTLTAQRCWFQAGLILSRNPMEIFCSIRRATGRCRLRFGCQRADSILMRLFGKSQSLSLS